MSDAAIATQRLTKHFGDVVALDDVSLIVERGEVFGYLGPNGAGKTTTLRLLLGLIRPTAGSAQVMGMDVADVKASHPHLAYVPGDVALWPKLTGAECLHLMAKLHGSNDDAYRDVLIERFELDPDRRSRAYSKGNRQKVALIAAFATRADVLVFDEPTSGLDPLMEQQFRVCVAEAVERGQTIFLSSHLLDEVEVLCQRVGILRRGRLVEVADVDDLRRLHGTVLDVDVEPGTDVSLLQPGVIDGVAAVTPTASGVQVQLTGPPGPLLQVVAQLPVTAIRSREASLEEVFLAYYGDGAEGS